MASPMRHYAVMPMGNPPNNPEERDGSVADVDQIPFRAAEFQDLGSTGGLPQPYAHLATSAALPLPPSPFRRHFQALRVASPAQRSLPKDTIHHPTPPTRDDGDDNDQPTATSSASFVQSPSLSFPASPRAQHSLTCSQVLAATLASALPRVALFRFNDPRADGLLALNDELLPTGQVAVGMPGAAGGDIIIDDEVWPWAPGEYLEEVFESEGIEVGVVDHRGRRVRRTKLPLVLREGWRLLVVSPLTGAALVYTLMRDSPYGIGRDPAEFFGEEIVVRIFSFLEVRTLCAVALVSQSWKRISEDNSLWREKCLNAKPFLRDQLVRVSEEKKASWRTLYRCIAYPHRWSRDRKPSGVKVTNEGRTAKVKGPTATNVSVQTSRPIKAGAEPFWYFEAAVDKKPPPWNIGFGIADSEWSLEIKFVGFDKESFNYGYTSNGKMRATTQYEDFTTYGQGDRVGFWLEYFYPGLDLTVHVFLNDVLVHSWDHVSEKHKPPLYFTATLYHDGTQVSLVT